MAADMHVRPTDMVVVQTDMAVGVRCVNGVCWAACSSWRQVSCPAVVKLVVHVRCALSYLAMLTPSFCARVFSRYRGIMEVLCAQGVRLVMLTF